MGGVFSRTVSLPDQLTVARVAAVPIVVVLFAWNFPNHAYWATAVFVVAMATDQIDGWLARRSGISSPLGTLLDPVADKVLVLAALVMLIGEGVAPAWMVALIVVREILVSGLRLAAIERGVVLPARDLGRAEDLGAGARRDDRGPRCRRRVERATSRGGRCSSRSQRRGSRDSTTRASRRACCAAKARSASGRAALRRRPRRGRAPPRARVGGGHTVEPHTDESERTPHGHVLDRRQAGRRLELHAGKLCHGAVAAAGTDLELPPCTIASAGSGTSPTSTRARSVCASSSAPRTPTRGVRRS